MALKPLSQDISDPIELQHALTTASFELNYERSKRAIESVSKDEDIRKLKFQLRLLEDENEELHDQLEIEADRVDSLQHDLEDAIARSEELDAEIVNVTSDLRLTTRELETTRTELLSLENVSTDQTKLLTEKLALARELSVLKPELEHLRSQSTSNQNLLSEKLSLQRQLSTIEVELENEKRSTKRALEKSKSSNEQLDASAEHEAEIEDLKRKLKEEKVLHKDAKKASEHLKRELETEKQSAAANAEKAESAAKEAEMVAKTAAKNDAKADSAQVDELKKDLSKEKREREKAEKGIQKAQTEWEAQKSMLDDKLNAFRTKLKSTKEKLKKTEGELEKAQAAAATAKAAAAADTKPGAKNPRKRAADPDAAIGTPGDGVPAKRGKRAQSVVGEKSSFSITPFLNRASSVAPTSPIREEDEEEDGKPNEVEADATPSAAAKKVTKKAAPKSKPLAPAASAKTNAKATGAKGKRASKAVPSLEKVTEAEEETSPIQKEDPKPRSSTAEKEQENQVPKTTTTTTTVALGAPIPKLKPSNPSKKPRKSIHDFKSFNVEPEPEKKKKRKLLGQGFGKTLFDDEEEDAGPAKPIPGRGLFAGRGLATMGKDKGGKPLITAPDGFQFSPLKKERRAGSVQPGGR